MHLLELSLKLDARLSQKLSLPPQSGWRFWVGRLAHLGDGPLVFGGLALVYGLGWLAGAARWQATAVILTLLVLAAILVVTLIKFGVRRQRPQPPGEFVTFAYDVYSFPSGHAARLAALATGTIFFDSILGYTLLVLALSVALARVMLGIHYLSDIVIGLLLGALVAWQGMVGVKFLNFVL